MSTTPISDDSEFLAKLTALVNNPTRENELVLFAYIDALIKKAKNEQQ